jgi:hypothetical protein
VIQDPSTPILTVISGVKGSYACSGVQYIREQAKLDNKECLDIWAKILMACEKEQVTFLQHLWNRFPVDDLVTMTWFLIVKRGFFLDFLDPENKKSRDLFMLCHACVEAGDLRGTMNAGAGRQSGRNKLRDRIR